VTPPGLMGMNLDYGALSAMFRPVTRRTVHWTKSIDLRASNFNLSLSLNLLAGNYYLNDRQAEPF
jgi:hypothetical protein